MFEGPSGPSDVTGREYRLARKPKSLASPAFISFAVGVFFSGDPITGMRFLA